MKTLVVVLFITFMVMFLFLGNGLAFRCGTDLFGKGDSKIKVSISCGEPTLKEQRCYNWHPETGVCINRGEAWYYNCGQGDYIYVLNFSEGSILMGEGTAGRGSGISACQGKAPQ